MTFGEWVKKERKKLDLSQTDLAEKLGVTPGFISKIQNGVAFPSYELIASLADIFSADQLAVWKMVEAEKLRQHQNRRENRKAVLASIAKTEFESQLLAITSKLSEEDKQYILTLAWRLARQ